MRWGVCLLWLAVACTERHSVGQLPSPDAGVDPLTALREDIVGSWCGTATLPVLGPERVVVEFRPDGAVLFDSDRFSDVGGSYSVDEVYLDGSGVGHIDPPRWRGDRDQIPLEYIRIEGEHLSMEISIPADSLPVPVSVPVPVPFELDASCDL